MEEMKHTYRWTSSSVFVSTAYALFTLSYGVKILFVRLIDSQMFAIHETRRFEEALAVDTCTHDVPIFCIISAIG